MSRQNVGKTAKIAQPAQKIGKPYVDSADIVIIGNGIAGLTAAVEARRLAPDIGIAIITEQCHPTINTPALKQFAIGKLTREQLLAYPAGTERAQRIHVLNARVEEINAQEKYVHLGGGGSFGYGSLLIATGSVSTSLPAHLPGYNFDGVLTLHRLQDYLDLRRRLSDVEEAVVIGGGAHAIETVMGLLHWGITVHWLIRSQTLLPRILDQPGSEMVLERIRRAGAKVYTETEVIGIIGRVGAVAGVVTNQEQMIPCQLVLACTGTSPVMTPAEHCNLPMKHKRGILVDDQFRTSVQDIYAAGDVAALKNPQSGTYETRAQWYAAVLQGRTVAAMMTGQHEAIEQPFGVPWHATHLGDLSMLTVGDSLKWTEGVTTCADTNRGNYRRMAILNDRLVGYLSLGSSQPDGLAIKRIIDEGLPIHDIKKALLKGNFDARKYFSKQRTYAAHGLVTSGKLPALNLAPTVGMINRALTSPTTGPIPAIGLDHDTGALPTASQESNLGNVGARFSAPIADAGREALPTTRPLETQSPVPDATYETEEEICSFTGNLPSISQKIVESTLVPLPRQNSGSLWSYTDQVPVKAKAYQHLPPAQNLWAYDSQRKQSMGERER